jgi:lysine 2,3-aminomutase
MAGAKSGEFVELLSPFLRGKLDEASVRFGPESRECLAIARQYLRSPMEDVVRPSDRRRHYESEVHISYDGAPLVGVERLYRRTILIEPTTACAAHCRWCLRGQYPLRTLKRDEVERAARYCGSRGVRDDLREVLITGGDPLMSLPLLKHTVQMLREHAPNIAVVRIGSRIPFQDPERVGEPLLELFASCPGLRFEIGLNINHPVEFWPESISSIQRLQSVGVRLYNQHPLLRGVNDDLQTLQALYALLREHDIDAHYLFHAIPMRGTAHHRTSLAQGLELAGRLCSSGEFSGRSKPRFAVLSDIGKIVLYHDSIVDRRDSTDEVLIQSGYVLEDRLRWNPSWELPPSAVVASDGTLMTWYLDRPSVGERPALVRIGTR